ncbi:hypothetical protein B9Z19DRAFT_395815 [Tuber borchii]|uniref:Uncharacterized protein n=1 Tax=Tuber borchii TaxID=42251 RepID=A0A2T6ZH89_TUBBO|nr:hypothetical protein B9Z19DRAFT_395815 [Tuber borchii]
MDVGGIMILFCFCFCLRPVHRRVMVAGCVLVDGVEGGFLLLVPWLGGLFLKIAVFWPDARALRWGYYASRGWYFPDVLRDRQVGLAYPGIVMPFGAHKPGLAVAPLVIGIKYIETTDRFHYQLCLYLARVPENERRDSQ